MKILVIPDKFKDSLSAQQVCSAVEEGIKKKINKAIIKKIPLADGGEGSLIALESTIKFERNYLQVNNPHFKKIRAYYGLLNKTAYIEMALASGIQLLKQDERKVMLTSSFGTGELIKDAINKGAKKLLLFVGGSATNDFGIGIASALGYKFYDKDTNRLKPIGKNLIKINSIDQSEVINIKGIEFNVLTDVNNLLYGKNGAAYVFAKQKGASDDEIFHLDKGLRNAAKIVNSTFNIDVAKIPGSGAAGGIGGGMAAFCSADIISGINTIMGLLRIENKIKESDFIITGEGKLDQQTLEGKVVKGVVDLCNKYNKPLGIVCGVSTLSYNELSEGNVIVKPIKTDEILVEDAIKNAYSYLVERSMDLVKEFQN